MSRFVVSCTWDEVPHLSEEQRQELWDSYPEWEREARFKGTPVLGSGKIYTVPEEDIRVKDFEIPEHWPRAYGFDVGWNCTAAIWGARDLETSTVYLYSEHWRGEAEPIVHAESVKARGSWIPGVIDPASRGRAQKDGIQLLKLYRQMGIDVKPANNAVEAGVRLVWTQLSIGKLKVFESCQHWFEEFRLYRRDDKGRVVKEADHLMDATRYLMMSGIDRMKCAPVKKSVEELVHVGTPNEHSWMGV
jgi:hypothetical protein